MNIEFGEITCKGLETSFQILAKGRLYVFTFANTMVYEYLGETEKPVDCSQFVLECQELFAEIAESMIAKNPHLHNQIIDIETIEHCFNRSTNS